VTVFWSATALGHLTAIRNYIALNSLNYADAMIRRIIQRAEQLQHAPMMGAVVPQYADNAVREVLERPTGSSIEWDPTGLTSWQSFMALNDCRDRCQNKRE
jgi:plasmid stabilization system protein ParE